MIERFLNPTGQVEVWPAKEAGKIAVLEYLVVKFEKYYFYTEPQVNEILRSWHTLDDWALLRRELFDRGYFNRELDGSAYKRSSKDY